MKKFNLFVGLATLSLAFVLNAQHALNNYGVSDPSNKLHPEVIAQTNSLCDGSSSGGSSSGSSVSCISGGPGSSSCAHSGGLGPVSYNCEVSCREGFFACCNANCTCVPNS